MVRRFESRLVPNSAIDNALFIMPKTVSPAPFPAQAVGRSTPSVESDLYEIAHTTVMLFSPSSRGRLTDYDLGRFPDDTLFHRLARAVCQAGCLPRKELFEAWETARRVRVCFAAGASSMWAADTVSSRTRCSCWTTRPPMRSSWTGAAAIECAAARRPDRRVAATGRTGHLCCRWRRGRGARSR